MTDNLTLIQIKKSINPSKNERTVIAQIEYNKTIIHQPLKINKEAAQIASINSSVIKKQNQYTCNELHTVNIGSVINNRFVLEEVLGVGGMGKVYKAVDLRKKEAHDKHPYIAIKVLNDEFRDHPESLIALQREARKSQQLSHPNIVNVYDFDRDGDIVYMTMELLQGRPLDELISEEFPLGMTEEESTPIINAIANALLYAHQHGIIHSDLKPSNIFITDDHKAKIFDFGIARACQISHGQLQDNSKKEKTLFDPTVLGALTPTYASLEMLEGKAPEPHDDIYSIACVFYELLTGKHPYKRLPADEAKFKSLKFKKIASLDKYQFKTKSQAIQKALNFEGKNRFQNIEMFIKAYNYKKTSKRPILLSSFVIMTILSFIFFSELQEQYYFYQQIKFIEQVNSLTPDVTHNETYRIQQHINTLDHQTRLYVLEHIKTQWLLIVEQHIFSLERSFLNKTSSRNDDKFQLNKYNNAHELLKISQVYYSDSAQVARLSESFEKHKFIEINYINSQFNELLEILQFSQLSSTSIEHEQILELVNRVKNIEENHPLVKDQRLLLIYQDNIEHFLSNYNFNEANNLIDKAYSVFPNDIILQNLIDKSKSLENSRDNEIIYLTGNSEKINHGVQSSSMNLSSLKDKLSELINKSELSQEWDNNVTNIFTHLHDRLGNRSLWLNEKKQTLAFLYLKNSVSMRDERRLVEARRLLEKSKSFTSGIFGMDDEEAILLALENIVKVKQKARQRLAKIEGLKNSLNTQLKAQEMTSAIRTYAILKRILGRNDPYISREAKQTIAQVYYNQARHMFFNKNYQQTIEIIIKGLKFEGHHGGLRSLKIKAEKQKKILENSRKLARESSNKRTQQKINKTVAGKDKNKENTKTQLKTKKVARNTIIDSCKEKFSGYGKKKRANCYDKINPKINAPVLVVVPPVNPSEKAFAITKYEVTINDYNYYCMQSGECTSRKGNGLLPITNISFSQAKKYSRWLSQITKKNYSLPTSGQWLHAAKTSNKVEYNDVNCQITFGSKLLKGKIMLAVNTGQPNPWGIMNIVGNAREFVVDNSLVYARGGAHIDPIKDCTVENNISNIAQGDSYTGFRLIRPIY